MITMYETVCANIIEKMREQDVRASHHIFTVKDWQAEVAAGGTRLGYHDWLAHTMRRALENHEVHFGELTPPPLVATNPEVLGE